MIKTTWEIVGEGADIRLMERRLEHGEDAIAYQDAKAEAISALERLVQPYLQKLSELKDDGFEIRGKLPQFNAWLRGDTLVIAKTQKRAAEMVRRTTYDFRTSFNRQVGDWWYRYAAIEAIWVSSDSGDGIREFRKLPSREEAEQVVAEELAEFQALPITELAQMVGQEYRRERSCSHHSMVTVVIRVERDYESPGHIDIKCNIESGDSFYCCGRTIQREA